MTNQSVIDNIKRLENRRLTWNQARQRREAYELGQRIAQEVFAKD